MDLLNVEYNLIQAKRAYLRFTYKKKCCVCDTPISDTVKLLLFSVLLFIRMRMFAIKPVWKRRRVLCVPLPNKTLKEHLSIDELVIYEMFI